MTDPGPFPLLIADRPTVWAYLDVSDPLVAWQVYRGELVSSTQSHALALSSWTADYLRGLPREDVRACWASELAIEALRIGEFPQLPSRLKGFYVFPDSESARAAARWSPYFKEDRLAELALRVDSRSSTHDGNWIHNQLGEAGDREWMRAYLSGTRRDDKPIWEMVVEGRAVVYGTDLREEAYKTVKAHWPESMAMLELSRLGFECDVDVGVVSAIPIEVDGGLEVRYFQNFDARDDSIFVQRLETLIESGRPVNHADLHPDAEWVTANLTDRYFRI